MTQPTAGRGRRRLLLILAAFLVLAAAGLPAGRYILGVREQRRAVEALRDAGATVAYDWEWRWDAGSLRDGDGELSGWRRFLADRFGPDAVATVAAVSLQGAKGEDGSGAGDEQIKLLGPLESLQGLRLGTFAISEEGTAPIAGLEQLRTFVVDDPLWKSDPGPILSRLGADSRLQRLILTGAALDDEDIAAISRFSRLETLQIGGRRKFGDADLAKLSALRRLKELWLPQTAITTEGLKSIEGMNSLESISLGGSSIDDLAPLRRLPALKRLDLGFCPVGDGGLSALGEMPALEALSLGSGSITAAGLEPLAAIKTLKQIRIYGSKITPEQRGEFAKAHPGIALQTRKGLTDDEVSTAD